MTDHPLTVRTPMPVGPIVAVYPDRDPEYVTLEWRVAEVVQFETLHRGDLIAALGVGASQGGAVAEQITTPEELDALPVGSVLLDGLGNHWFHDEAGGMYLTERPKVWKMCQLIGGWTAAASLPMTVLYRPDAPTPPAEDDDTFTLDLRTCTFSRPITGDEGARIASAVLPGTTPEAVNAWYEAWMADDTSSAEDREALDNLSNAALLGLYWEASRGDGQDPQDVAVRYGRAVLAARQPAVPFAITAEHIARQRAFSLATFGPGKRTAGVVDHIRRELAEVEAAPDDLSEWADVIILAFDGAQRTGADPQAILDAVHAKQTRNEGRTWPDWRTQPTGRAIEHDRTSEQPAPTVSAERVSEAMFDVLDQYGPDDLGYGQTRLLAERLASRAIEVTGVRDV